MRRFFNLLLLAALIVVLAVNNPTKAEYVAWAKEQQMAQSKDPLSKAAVTSQQVVENASVGPPRI